MALENIEGWTGKELETGSTFDGDGVKFQPDDLLFGKLRPYLAKVFLAREPGDAVGDLWALRPEPACDPKFMFYVLVNQMFIDVVNGSTNGAKMPRAEWSYVGAIGVPTPPHGDQIEIARFLDGETGRIDGLIEKKARFIALLKEKEKAAISRLVRRGLDRNAPTIDSGVDWRGRVPAHWVRGRMKDHFRQEKRQGYEDLTVLSVYREFGVIEKSSRDDNINKTPEDLSKYQLVNPNDLVINKMKAWQGSMGIAPMRGITSPDYVVMRPIGEHDPRYMHHYLRAQPMPWVYRLISNGIRTDQWRMEPEKFLGLPVYMPPIEEQRLIAERIDVELERIRGLISLTERSIDLLREKRAALITAAVTGKIDVRAAA
ncbi:restriction endonuclease subunit S [Pararhodobacter aggregans]|uniref:Restriction endonuclease subunit S n=2 Tax=Pararhodobacter aggregans TaxID=404875 RepID=A0A2T7UKB9_9RHOB|nr:restriction endonuclease subunit S [Pararhodobacter aggregans]